MQTYQKPPARAYARFMTGLFGCLLLVLSTRPAAAQCELTGTTELYVGSTFIPAMTTILNAAFLPPLGATPAGVGGTAVSAIGVLNAGVLTLLGRMEDNIIERLGTFWDDWLQAMKDQTIQLNSSLIEQTRQMATMFDSEDVTETAARTQHSEIESKKSHQPTTQSCRFDTLGRHMATATRTTEFMSAGIANDLNLLSNNKAGSPAAQGPAQLQKNRWNIYVTKFCDGVSNGGNPGCTAPGTMPNAHILPSRTFFAKETIDLNNADTKLAVDALVFNITGYAVSEPLKEDVLMGPKGKEQRKQNREYTAQMDAISSLVSSIVGERTPGAPAPDVQQMRQSLGILDASPRPSEREIRQSVVEQLWDPNYYVELGDAPGTVMQKEVYLQAYNLYLLNKIIEKTEKISTVYALQTANLLEKVSGYLREDGIVSKPFQ